MQCLYKLLCCVPLDAKLNGRDYVCEVEKSTLGKPQLIIISGRSSNFGAVHVLVVLHIN